MSIAIPPLHSKRERLEAKYVYLDSMPCDLQQKPDFDGPFRGLLALVAV